MKDLAVVTTTIGEKFEKMARITHPSIKAYADKINADFIILDKIKVSKKYPSYERFQLFDLLTKYLRIIYIDTDIIIRPDCPNLFEVVPEKTLGLFNEGRFIPDVKMGVMSDVCRKYKINIPKWNGEYYNTGVMVTSRLHRHLFKKPVEEFDTYAVGPTFVYHYEQPYLNAIIITENYKVTELNHKFNRISVMDEITGENKLDSYILHYAGVHYDKNFEETLKNDLKNWQESAPEYKYPRNFKIIVGGGIGDQIDAEPVVRYICEKIYIGDNIHVKTDFPFIFKHLPVTLIKDKQIKEATVFHTIETLPAPETPIWNYIAQTLCHTTDFASISALRRVLPDIDKQIRLDVDKEALESVRAIIGNETSIENLILVHPGKGWKSKTFPQEYWQEIIDKLVDENFKIAIIGKYISEEQGIIDVNIPKGAIDLRNLLSLDEMVALISKAKILISNDSAPIHMAGAFDNFIVFIPTCKHPDHVLPYRKGSKNYKSIALYKKLTCDSIDSSPTQVDGATVDIYKGDIMDYLPETSVVINAVKDFINSLS